GVSDERRRGWRDALREAGLPLGPEHQSAFSYAGGAALAQQLAARAVVVSSDVQALGLLSGLHQRGVRVPDDVALVSIDGTRAGRYAVPRLSSIAQPVERMAAEAVGRLIDSPREIVHLTLPN